MNIYSGYRFVADPTGKVENQWTDYSIVEPRGFGGGEPYAHSIEPIQFELMTDAAKVGGNEITVRCDHVDGTPAGLHFQERYSGAPLCSPRWNGRYVETIDLQTAIAFGIARMIEAG